MNNEARMSKGERERENRCVEKVDRIWERMKEEWGRMPKGRRGTRSEER